MADHDQAELRPDPWWREPREEITELSEHICDKLSGAGLKTIADVRAAGPDALQRIPGIGPVALAEIMAWLRWLDGDDE